MKRTYQPKNRQEKKEHGFMKRMKTKSGRNVLKARRGEKIMKKTKMLKKNYEFKNVLTKGKYYSGKRIEAFIKYNKSNISINFLGIAISSKIAKAVKRNKIKRLIRESYKSLENNIDTSNSIVFLWKKKVNIEEATYENIKKDIEYILKKANIFIEEE